MLPNEHDDRVIIEIREVKIIFFIVQWSKRSKIFLVYEQNTEFSESSSNIVTRKGKNYDLDHCIEKIIFSIQIELALFLKFFIIHYLSCLFRFYIGYLY